MWRTVLVFVSVLLVSACAPKWQRANTTPQQLAQDEYECAMEVRDPAPSMVVAPAPYGYPRGSAYADGSASGYALGRGIHIRSLYKACMRARGYTEE